MAVIEDHGGEVVCGKVFGEWCQACRLHSTDAVCHHHRRVRSGTVWQVEPGVQLVAGLGRDSQLLPGHRAASFGMASIISPPASRARPGPNSAAGVYAPLRYLPDSNSVATRAATRAVKP